VDLDVSVFEVAEPECLKALVDGQHRLNTIDKSFQTSLQLWHLVRQSNVLHYLQPQQFLLRQQCITLEKFKHIFIVFGTDIKYYNFSNLSNFYYRLFQQCFVFRTAEFTRCCLLPKVAFSTTSQVHQHYLVMHKYGGQILCISSRTNY